MTRREFLKSSLYTFFAAMLVKAPKFGAATKVEMVKGISAENLKRASHYKKL